MTFHSPWDQPAFKKPKHKAKKVTKAPTPAPGVAKKAPARKKVTKKAAVRKTKPAERPRPAQKPRKPRKTRESPAGVREIVAPTPRGGKEGRDFLRKVGKGKGDESRVWLEGKILERAGFKAGSQISIDYDEDVNQVVIRLDPEGRRVVSKHGEKPVVDIVNKSMTRAMKGVDRVVVDFQTGFIVLNPWETERRIKERLDRRDGTVGSAFTGAGFMDLAAEMAGYVSRYGIELDPRYADMYQSNRERSGYPLTVIKQPIELALALHDRRVSTHQEPLIPQVELLLMGIPCDPFSQQRGGRTKIPAAEHSLYDMTHYALALAAACNPLNIVIEEVPGYLSDPMYGVLKSVLEKAGYHVTSRLVDSNIDLGYIAKRDRAYVVATTIKGFSWEEALRNAAAPRDMRKLSDVLLPPDHPAITTALESQGNWFSTHDREGIGKFLREAWGRPDWSPTFIDQSSKRIPAVVKEYYSWQATGPWVKHPAKKDVYRALTVQEIRKMHGVPEDYALPGAVGTQAEALGQAVIVPLIEGIIRALPGGAPSRTVDVRHRRVSNPAPFVSMYYGTGPLYSTLPWEWIR